MLGNVIDNNKIRTKHLKMIILIFALSLWPFFRHGISGVFIPPDAGGGLDMLKRLIHNSYTWEELNGTGGADTTAWYMPPFVSHLPLVIPYLFLPLELAQRVMFSLILFFQGLSVYLFTNNFLKIENREKAALIAALFYMFNPWFMGNWWTGNFFFNYGSIFLPAALWCFMDGLENKDNTFARSCLLAVISTFMLTPHIQFFLLQIYILILYFCFYLAMRRQWNAFYHAFKFVLLASVIFLILNLFWIIPTIGSLMESKQYLDNLELLKGFREGLSSIRLYEYIRLLGMGIYNASFDCFYSLHIGCWTSFFLTAFVYIGILLKSKNRHIIFFSAAALFFTLIPSMIAKVMIVQNIYVKLINTPIVGIILFPRSLRFPQLAVFAYAFLLGAGTVFVASALEKNKKILKNVFIAFMAISILINASPMVFKDLGGHLKPVKIPKYYNAVERWLKEQGDDFKILLTPHAHLWGNIRYLWAKNIVRHVDFAPVFFIPKPFLQKLPAVNSDKGIISFTDSAIHNSPGASLFLSLLNVRYILHRKDVEAYEGAVLDFKPLDEKIYYKASFGELDFYEISDDCFLPHIYTSSRFTNVVSDEDMDWFLTVGKNIGEVSPFLLIEKGQGVEDDFLALQGLVSEQGLFHDNKHPEIIFKKVNPAKYLIKIKGAKDPFWLVFSENFHKHWKMYLQKDKEGINQAREEIVAEYPKLNVKECRHLTSFTPDDIKFLFQKPLRAGHYMVNWHANGWYINPQKLGLENDFTITLFFWPQGLFYFGLMISILFLMACVISLFYLFKKRQDKCSKLKH